MILSGKWETLTQEKMELIVGGDTYRVEMVFEWIRRNWFS